MTHSALSSRSLGISSGIFRISLSTVPASFTRPVSLSFRAARVNGTQAMASKTEISFFIDSPYGWMRVILLRCGFITKGMTSHAEHAERRVQV